MAHAARIENGVVDQVIVVPDGLGGDESDEAIQSYINSLGIEGTWIRTSYNANIRGKYAGIGDLYDEVNDQFVSPIAEEPPAP